MEYLLRSEEFPYRIAEYRYSLQVVHHFVPQSVHAEFDHAVDDLRRVDLLYGKALIDRNACREAYGLAHAEAGAHAAGGSLRLRFRAEDLSGEQDVFHGFGYEAVEGNPVEMFAVLADVDVLDVAHFVAADFVDRVVAADDAYCNAKLLSDSTGGELALFFKKLASRSPKHVKIWEEYVDYLRLTIDSLRTAFDCNVVLGGYVGAYLEPYLDMIRAKVADMNSFQNSADFVTVCKYKHEASAVGAALQFISDFLETV